MIKSDFVKKNQKNAVKKDLITVKKSLSDYMFPHELIQCNLLNDEILLYNQKVHSIAALTTVISVATALSSGKIWSEDTAAPSSLYLCLILPTGAGKNIVSQFTTALVGEHIQEANLTSLGSFDDMLVENPNVTHIIDEYGDELSAMLGDKGGHKKSIMRAQKNIYSASKSFYFPQKYSTAGGTKKIEDRKVLNPCYSLIGLTTEAQLFDRLDKKLLSNGFLNRIIFINGSDIPSTFNDVNREHISHRIAEYIKTIRIDEKIKMDKEAKDFYENIIGDVDRTDTDIQLWVNHDEEKREISARWRENSIRLAVALAGYEKMKIIPLWLIKWSYSFIKFNSMQFIETFDERKNATIDIEIIEAAIKWFSKKPDVWHTKTDIARNATRLSGMLAQRREPYLNEMIEKGLLVVNEKNEYKYKRSTFRST